VAAAEQRQDRRIDWGRATIATLVISAVGWIQFRYVLTHFSNGGHLLDTGWFAYLLGSGDPLLTNPRAIDGLNYFAYHLTPWLSGVGMAAHAAGIDGFLALAIHQGAMFALLTAALIALALREAGWPGFTPLNDRYSLPFGSVSRPSAASATPQLSANAVAARVGFPAGSKAARTGGPRRVMA
jgi:hypothetical protein